MLRGGLEKLLTVSCRFLGLGSRFLLTFLLTKEISLEFQAEYTLVSTSIGLLIILFGFDFYVHANRSIIKGDRQAIFYFKNSLVFYGASYLLLFSALAITANTMSFVGLSSFWTLYLLIVFEHLGQEFFRTYIALRKQLFANILLFLRTGLWAGIIVLNFLFVEDYALVLDDLLLMWLGCAIITCVLAITYYPGIASFFKIKLDYAWIKKGLKVGLTMFTATVCLKIIEYSDRYLIAFFLSKTELGVYALFFQLANLINVVIFTMYISFEYPDIVQGAQQGNVGKIKKGVKTIRSKSILLVGLYAISSIVFIPIFLDYLGKTELNENTSIFYILIVASLLLNWSYSYHYLIVGYEKEKQILVVTGIACVVNVLANAVLIPLFGIHGAALSLVFAYFCLLVLKRYYALNIMKKWK